MSPQGQVLPVMHLPREETGPYMSYVCRTSVVRLSYFTITARLEDVTESSYTNRTTGEIVTKIQLSLVVPSMRDWVLCELPLEKAPTTDMLDRWELEGAWIVVTADARRALA